MGAKVVCGVVSSGRLSVFSVAGMCVTLVEECTSVEEGVRSIGIFLLHESSC